VVERVRVPESIRDTLPLIQTSIPKTVDVVLNLDEKTPEIEADPGQLQQVVMNLVINGAEAIGEERPGRVEIRTAGVLLTKRDVAEQYAADQLLPGSHILIEVQDTGSGMDEATKARIFDPFFTTKFTGRGLGLAAAQGIIRGHGGAIRVFTAPGQGSLFRVVLPAAAPEAVAAPPDRETARNSAIILIVDDEETVRSVVSQVLERAGHSTLVAGNGQAAVELFEEHSSEIRLVLLDLLMPVMGGEETFNRIRQVRSDVPIVLLSGFDEAEAIRRFGERRFTAFVQKPFTFPDLLRTVSEAMEA
jgi:CheY-like chemotaxis protein